MAELLAECGHSVKANGDDVVITRCYAQREATPLPIYLHQADWPEIQRVLNDLGWCLKQMAAAGLFPGEFDLKNFGVAEDGRVVFFDFDGLDELGAFGFDHVPLEGSLGQEDCFEYLLITYRASLIEVFRQLHPDLFTSAYWHRIQRLLKQGEVLDTFPYPAHKRLQNRRAAAGRPALALPAAVGATMERLGLRTAHRRGQFAWQAHRSAVAVGRLPVAGLDPVQQAALQQAFGVTAVDAAQLDVVVVDGVPVFVSLPEASNAVLDLSAHYDVEREVADEWRDRVQREVFGAQKVEFVRDVPGDPGRGPAPRA
jgi:hypothetical protein